MSFVTSALIKAQAPEKTVTGANVRSKDRAAVINRLCDTRGTEYRGLKQYRSM